LTLPKALNRVALGAHITLGVNASQVEKFQGKAAANSLLVSKAESVIGSGVMQAQVIILRFVSQQQTA
jgi:hypothetical protein